MRHIRVVDLQQLAGQFDRKFLRAGEIREHVVAGIVAAYPRTAVIGEPSELRISLLATGRFISIFPDSVYRFSARRPELQVLPVKQSLGHVPVGIVLLKNRTISPLAQLFINGCRELAKQLAKKSR